MFVPVFFICFLPYHALEMWFHLSPTAQTDYNDWIHALRIMGFCLSENLSEGAHCATCEQWFHYQCAGVTKSGYQRLSKDKKLNWRCVKCKPSETAHPPNSPRPDSESDLTGTEAVLTEIRALSAKFAPLEGLKEEVLALKKEFLDFKSSMNTQFSDVVNEFRSKINEMEQRIVLMDKVQCQVDQLQERIDQLEEGSNRNEQWLRMNNIELKGVPQSNNENLIDIVAKIGARINYPVSKNLINFISRVPSQQKEHFKPIIVGFCNRYIKEDFIAAARYELKTSPLTLPELLRESSGSVLRKWGIQVSLQPLPLLPPRDPSSDLQLPAVQDCCLRDLIQEHTSASLQQVGNPTESVVISNYDYGSTKKKSNIISRNSADGVTIMTIRDTNDFLTGDIDEKCITR
ncbi:hypothetical protein HF086_010293 [Spodoptera exigua]|uniref:Zinc finger PHD-type domain-containing protein n=1 Tax=Spodoptera exigua TaxID=7107 RepID=A0A922MYP3_SPOEX|nr:hypothetical protein HF086_010293 [Spodoptera exigua]